MRSYFQCRCAFVVIAISFCYVNSYSVGIKPMVLPINAGMSKAFAVEVDSSIVLIDAGSPGQEKHILNQIKRFSTKPLRLIIITHAHFDHYGSAEKLRALTGARIAIHEADASDMAEGKTRIDHSRGWGRIGILLLPAAEAMLHPEKTVADIILKDGDSLSVYGLPAVIVHTPGHSPGSCSVFLNDGTAIVGDLLVSKPWIAAQCYYATDWQQIKESIEYLESYAPKRIFSGHSNKPLNRKAFSRLLK